ncbi:regulatory protein RecX [candidate division KSB1 bacterium]|nr:regulatory protein RecX [candidate division KSB1 bacterium]
MNSDPPEKPRRKPAATALQHAVKLLAARPYSERKLKEKLYDREFQTAEIRGALDRLKQERLLDDEKFAMDFVHARLNSRPRAATALIRDLLARGIPMDIARKVVKVTTESTDEAALAMELVRRKLDHYHDLDERVRWRRLAGLLARRGFSPDTIRKVLREALKADPAE